MVLVHILNPCTPTCYQGCSKSGLYRGSYRVGLINGDNTSVDYGSPEFSLYFALVELSRVSVQIMAPKGRSLGGVRWRVRET